MIVFSVRPLPFNYFSLFSVNLLLELLGLLSLVKKKHLLSQSNWSDSMKVQFTYICIYVYICHGHCSVTWDKDTVREKWLELFFLPVTGWFLTYPCLISHKLRTCLSVLRMNRGVCQPEERRSSGLSHSPCSPPFTLRRSTWYSLTNTLSLTIMQAAITACSTV